MIILITGTAGFIGFHLTEKLLNAGHLVIGIDQVNSYYDVKLKKDRLKFSGIELVNNSSEGIVSTKYPGYTFYKADLENKKLLNEIFLKEQPDAVCNLAAQAGVRYSLKNPEAYINSNIVGFQNIIEACRTFNIKNFSYASSSSVYGGNENLPFNEEQRVESPISLYAATKRSNELVAYTYSHLFKISTTGLRFFTVYGPWGRPDMALFLFVKALLSGESINVFNNGNMLRDFTYIDDITEGISKVIENPAKEPKESSTFNPTKAPYKIYNIGNNDPIKLMDFINCIEEKLNKKFKINLMPIQPGDVPNTYANVDLLVNELGYKPNTPIQNGINNFVNWYLEYYKK
jgi:UDP-glucuronate 4-epimerase